MTGPALAILGGSEQSINNLFVGIGGFVGEEGLDLAWRRRQADQIVVNSPQQRRLFRRWHRSQAAGLQLGENKCVGGRLYPIGAFDRGNRRASDLAKRPEAARFRVHARRPATSERDSRRGPRNPHLYPTAKYVELRLREFALGWHLRTPVLDRLEQKA